MSRGNEFRAGRQAESWATNDCSTGKRTWPTRKGAKTAMATYKRQGADAMSPYQCDECELWHIGHLPKAVKDGLMTRGEYYGRDAA
jgi:hypothetical protein